jgi:hypothetical protein
VDAGGNGQTDRHVQAVGAEAVSMWPVQSVAVVERLISNQYADWDAERLNALYLGGAFSTGMYLRPSGEVIYASDDAPDEVFTDQVTLIRALIAGSSLHPELQSLLPIRSANAIKCDCARLPAGYRRALCPDCGGLGWREKSGIFIFRSN